MSARKGGLNRGLDRMIQTKNQKKSEESDNKVDITLKDNQKKESAGTKTPAAEKTSIPAGESGELVQIVRLSKVEPNRAQPRKNFDEEKIEELSASIKEHGVIQPLLVQAAGDHFEIIAGERRWRAAKKADIKEVPVIVKEYSPREVVEISLIENIQREDLNPVEEAEAYDSLMKEFSLTQEELAKRVSKNRASVANTIRLLKLPAEVRGMLVDGSLSEGCGRALLGLPTEEAQTDLAKRAVKEKMTVREVEKAVQKLTKPVATRTKQKDTAREAQLAHLSEQLQALYGTRVQISERSKNKGKFEIDFYSADEFERLFALLSSVSESGEA